MSDINRIVERIIEQTAGVGSSASAPSGMIPAQTTSGNPSVSYLPGGFTSMKNMMRSLTPVKKKWKLEVIEDNENYRLKIEDALDVIVPKFAWAEFNNKVMRVQGLNEIDLNSILNEAKTEEVHNLYDKLVRVMTVNLRENKQVSRTIVLMNYWLSVFRKSRFIPLTQESLISLNNYDGDVRKIVGRIQNIYSDDIGNLQMLIRSIEDERPLNTYEPFSEYEYLFGTRIQSEYEGIMMTLELTLNMIMVPTQSLYIESAEVLAELESFRTVKVLNNIVMPVDMMFAPGMFSGLRTIIDTLESKSEATP